ncbi:hypothetical protein EKO04_002822 [Ascochyta lentis]|uniref:Family A G protein-coupled receptor-like protein n=1 Tax=Ascochyta lentis TaxID=205686 RepID=A0A8H7JAS9_9PLEO|nr:hypothetical protein EKO04_002822 [Ascochyta lentis]
MASNLVARANNAININGNTVNGVTADIAITTHGSDLYFAICSAMGFAGFTFIALAFRKKRRDRLFHYITAAVVFVACIAYFTMGSNLGFVPIAVEFPRNNPVVRGNLREIFYVRYIDWFITTPLLLLDLLLTAGMPWPTILWIILVDEIMIVTGLIGALVVSRYKFAYFTIGCVALFYIVYVLVFEARRHALRYGPEVNRCFTMCGSMTTVLWILYPVAWGLCEGGNVISPDSEAIFYSVLDFIAKPIFGALLIYGHRNIDPASIGMDIMDYEGDAVVREKRAPNAPLDGPAHTNGTDGVNGNHV